MNLLVFCDGTWNTPQQLDDGKPAPTNVVKLRNAVAENTQQRVYYHSGVGTEGGVVDRYIGGGIGEGLDKNIISAYYWLATRYQPGDKIWLFGFSRGAYTVRSLGGMISRCGLLNASQAGTGDDKVWEDINDLFSYYRQPAGSAPAIVASVGRPFYSVATGHPTRESIPVYFIGVWETVGALGIPDDMALANLLDDPKKYAFHDTSLSPIVEHARHALALDEQRQSFIPTLWDNVADNPKVKQRWFAGVHADVGGGYAQCGLSDITLQWMMTEAAGLGLMLLPGIDAQLAPDPHGLLHDSVTGIFKLLHTCPRSVPRIVAGSPDVDASVIQRQSQPMLLHGRYRPLIDVTAEHPATFDVFARERWNATGIWLEAGVEYRFMATGKWVDGSVPCDAGGTDDGKFYPGEAAQIMASVSDKLEALWKGGTKNQDVDFWLSRRVGTAPWFALIGVVANQADPATDAPESRHEIVVIGSGCRFTPAKSGYFYAYANDAWQMYDNNRGSVSLMISR
ncbi:TPA: DUF2235 domain-containing protein [Raoultella ornithinolytica]